MDLSFKPDNYINANLVSHLVCVFDTIIVICKSKSTNLAQLDSSHA